VYSSNRGGTFGLWRIGLEGGAAQRVPVAARTVDSPVLSRDGRRLVYEEWTGQTNLFVLDSGNVQAPAQPVTASTRWDWNPQPTPDGVHFAFVSDRSGTVELWVADANDGEPRRLTSFGGPYVGSPAWSNDQRQIAFESPATDGNFDVYQVAADGGTPERLTDDPAPDRFPHYTPQDGKLLFTRGAAAIGNLATRRDHARDRAGYAGRRLLRLRRPGGDVTCPGSNERACASIPPAARRRWSCDLEPIDCANWTLQGNRLWYVRRDAERDAQLAVLDLASGETRQVAALPRLLYKSGLGVDGGGRVYFASVVSSETDLLMTEIATR
jgi:Tol biopolymer transport system component